MVDEFGADDDSTQANKLKHRKLQRISERADWLLTWSDDDETHNYECTVWCFEIMKCSDFLIMGGFEWIQRCFYYYVVKRGEWTDDVPTGRN